MTTRYTVYRHTHVESGRCYVGLTKLTMMKRWNRHVYDSKKKTGRGCSHFWNAIRTYGKDAFSHEVLETCFTLEAATEAEVRWIGHFRTREPEFGFNLAKGGAPKSAPLKINPWSDPRYRAVCSKNWAAIHTPEARASNKAVCSTPEVRAKLSKAGHEISDSKRAKLAGAAKARVWTPEMRAKLSTSLKGRKLSADQRAKLSQANKNRVVSQVTRDKLSAAGRGRKPSAATRKKIGAAASISNKNRARKDRS